MSLEEEMTDHVGYPKHDPTGRESGNSRNGTRTKTVITDNSGPVQIEVPRDRAGTFEPVIVAKSHLSPAHRDDLAGGCPSAALLDEIGRCDVAVREAYTAGARSMIGAIARHLAGGDPQLAKERATGVFCLLVGSLQAARALTDPELSDRILTAAYANAMTLAAAVHHPVPPTRQETA